MQKRKEHTEMEILSLPTAKNQEEFITFPLQPREHNVMSQEWLEVVPGSGAGRMFHGLTS